MIFNEQRTLISLAKVNHHGQVQVQFLPMFRVDLTQNIPINGKHNKLPKGEIMLQRDLVCKIRQSKKKQKMDGPARRPN